MRTLAIVPDAVAVIRTLFHILHQPICEVVVVGGLDASSGLGDGGQRAGVVVSIGDRVAVVIEGFLNDPAVTVIGVGDGIAVSVGCKFIGGEGIGRDLDKDMLDRIARQFLLHHICLLFCLELFG